MAFDKKITWQPIDKLPKRWWLTPTGVMIDIHDKLHGTWAYGYCYSKNMIAAAEKVGSTTHLQNLGWARVYRTGYTLQVDYEVRRSLDYRQLRTLKDYAIIMGLELRDGMKDRLIPLTENNDIGKTNKYLYTNMNYRDFYKKANKSGQKPVSENLENKELLRGMNLEDTSCDDGLPKRADGALDIDHVGQPIHLSKIIQVGKEFGNGPASGEVSGFTSVNKTEGPAPAGTTDSEPIKAGGKVSPAVATKTVGGEVTGGQKQGGPNHKGSIAGTPKNSEIHGGIESNNNDGAEIESDEVSLSLEEAKKTLKKVVKEVLKEITFNRATGKWEKINEGLKDFSNRPDDEVPEWVRKSRERKRENDKKHPLPSKEKDKEKSKNVDENHDNAGFPTGGLAMGRPQYKISGPQFRTLDDRTSRSNQFEPEITEIHDSEEDESMMSKRLSELTNAKRNLSETELQEMKDLKARLGESKWLKGSVEENTPTPDNSGAAGPQYSIRNGDSQVEVPGKINRARQVQGDPTVNEVESVDDMEGELDEAGGQSIQTHSFRTIKDLPQNPKARQSDEVYESMDKKKLKGVTTPPHKHTGWEADKAIARMEKDKNYRPSPFQDSKPHPKPHKDATVKEGRCEDYPCCGHEAGDCPSRDSEGNEVWKCAGCGGKLPKNSRSSLCQRCVNKMSELDREDPTGQDSENFFDGMDETDDTHL